MENANEVKEDKNKESKDESSSAADRRQGDDMEEIKFPKPPRKRKPQSYMCEECGKIFNRADLLRNHKRVHSGDKPFTCEVCGDKFREQGHLRRHMTRHTGKKPYQCYICGKELNSSLAKHLRRHLNDRQFSCVLCDKKFVSGFELKQHILTHKKGTFQENSNRGTPSLDKREPKLPKQIPDFPSVQGGSSEISHRAHTDTTEAEIASFQKFAEETQMALYRRLAVAQGDQSIVNQFSDQSDPSLMNWDYLSYAAGMGLTPAVPNQQQFKSKSSGRKRLSDLSWDVSQSTQGVQQCTISKPVEQAASMMGTKKDMVTDEESLNLQDTLINQGTQNLQGAVLSESSKNMETKSNTESESYEQSIPDSIQDQNHKEQTEIPDAPSIIQTPDPSPVKSIAGSPSASCSSQTPDQSPLKAIVTETELNSDSFTKVQHLTISVKEEPPDVDVEDTAPTDHLSDDDPVEDFPHNEDSGSTTDEYEAEAYFQKLEDSSITEKDKSDSDWTPEPPKKSLKIKIKTPKKAPKRKATKKSSEKEAPKKKARKKKQKDEEELPTTVCTDSDTLFVIPPNEESPGNKKKRTAKKDSVFVCDECGKIFFRNDLLRNHMRVHTGDKPFTCEVCGESFRESGHLRRHMTRHTGKKPYKCELCGKELNSSLAKHMKRHMNDRQFPCTMCDKKFVSGFELKHHMIIHNTSDHIPCHICGRKFSHTNILQRHMLTHSENRPFPCPDCDKSYKCKQDLDRHRSIHKEVFTATCHICGKQFCQDRYLYRHLKRHQQLKEEGIDETERPTKMKPFSCEVCHQRFTTAPNLKQHMHLHFSTEKFACYLCSKMFTQKRYLQRHIRRHKENRFGKGSTGNMDDTDLLMGHMVATFNEENGKRSRDQLMSSSVYKEPDLDRNLEEGEVKNQSGLPEESRPSGQTYSQTQAISSSKPVFPSINSDFAAYDNEDEELDGSEEEDEEGEEEDYIPPNYLNVQSSHLAVTQPHSDVL
ncbi:zinc finger protein 629-like [Saccostrea echinata]|uniref:zinc finger protein 629-like n=1 Tax=Saccostrea echinata TaxID=191078 RepID=UPI002A81974A|nr:zinc finger protein 629-like [Saccostrea echinata]